MSASAAFEEKMSSALDALYDGAELLTEGPSRAEALVLAVVVEAAREPAPPEDPEEFRRWILARMIRHYLGYAKASGADGSGETEPDGAGRPDGRDRSALAERLDRLERTAPERLAEAIRRSMRALPLRERVALWLVNVMGFPYAEAAAALEAALGELRELLYRARAEMRLRLAIELRGRPGEGEAASGASGGKG